MYENRVECVEENRGQIKGVKSVEKRTGGIEWDLIVCRSEYGE